MLPLAIELRKYGLRIWLDKFVLKVGDSLREKIDEGLIHSRFGIVILSLAFFGKNWPKKELNGLFAREISGTGHILPVWHGLTDADVVRWSPMLTDRMAGRTDHGIAALARNLVQVIRPEAFLPEIALLDAQLATERLRNHVNEIFS